MALQPLPSVRYGRTNRNRGRRVPTTIEKQDGPNENDLALERQDAWNKAALLGTTNPTGTSPSNPEQPTREALAKAFGYKAGEATPPIGTLMARFQSLSPSVRAGIYKAGGAQFIDPEEGSEMLNKQADALEKVHDTHTNDVVSAMTAGKIEPVKDASGKVTWMVNQETDIDPNNPILGKKKVQVPVNPVIEGYIKRAHAKGYIPDPSTGEFPSRTDVSVSKTDIQRKMTAEQFQEVLDARARAQQPSTAANVAASLASAKMDVSGSGADATSTMSLTPYQYNSNMQVGKPYAYANPLEFKETPEMYGPPAPPPRQGYIPSGQLAQDTNINLEAAGNALLTTAGNAGDVASRGWNYLRDKSLGAARFLFGEDKVNPDSVPTSALNNMNAPLGANDAATIAAKIAAARKAQEDEAWFQSRRQTDY